VEHFKEYIYEAITGASEGPQGIRNTVKTWVEGIQQTVKKLIAGIKKASNGEISWDEILDDKDKGGYLTQGDMRLLRSLPGWTLRHAYFLIMGGFLLIEPDEESVMRSFESEGFTTAIVLPRLNTSANMRLDREEINRGAPLLTLDRLRELVKDPLFEIEVTKDEIADRSKGASFAKFITILQTSWFVVQATARVLNGLDLTLLEVSTLALACSNGIAILLWWHKPLGAQKPVRVLLKRRLTRAESDARERRSDAEAGFAAALTFNPIHSQMGGTWLFQLPFYIFIFLLSPSIIVAHALVRTISYLPARPLQPLFIAVVILSAISGAVHCAAWNFPFYTYTEQTLWRVASLAVTSTACITAIGISSLSPNTRTVLFAIITPVYATAKFVLLGLAVAQLRSLPPSSFVAIDWIQYYPHV